MKRVRRYRPECAMGRDLVLESRVGLSAKEGEEVSGFTGVEPLRHAVFPGGSYEFQSPFLHMPSEPGPYVLDLEMTSAYFGKFSG